MSEKKEIRLAELSEMNQVHDLVDRSFVTEQGGMEARWGHCYTEACLNNVVLIDGKVVSHVGLVPQTLVSGDNEVQCWGITGVSTYKKYRGKGYMSELMNLCIQQMEENNIALADLGGNRQRYNHFGFEIGGFKLVFDINERSMGDFAAETPDAEEHVCMYTGQEDLLETIIAIHQKERIGLKKNRDQYEYFMNRRGHAVLVYTEKDKEAYIVFSMERRRRMICELGGSFKGIAFLIGTVLREWDTAGADVICPVDHPLVPGLRDISSHWRQEISRMIKIVSLDRTLNGFVNMLNEHYSEYPCIETEEISMGMKGDTSAVKLVCSSDGVSVEKAEGEPDIELSEIDMVNLVFNPASFLSDIHVRYPVLKKLFPLNFFMWPADGA